MPPVILWGLGMVGAAVIGRWLVREARRVNAELHPGQTKPPPAKGEDMQKLERDPETGIYHPK